MEQQELLEEMAASVGVAKVWSAELAPQKQVIKLVMCSNGWWLMDKLYMKNFDKINSA